MWFPRFPVAAARVSATGWLVSASSGLTSSFLAAQDSYRANMTATAILDGRDIHKVQASEILEAINLKSGDIDLFDGSPPCQAFSTAGKRESGWGVVRKYEHGATQCNETLFDEYVRLLKGLQPKTFVAENVSGLVKGTAKGYFLEILTALKACGYRVSAKLLDAQWLGVPQMRQRIIFVGVREDLKIDPVHPEPLPYRYTVRDALPWISAVEGAHGFNGHAYASAGSPANTVSAMRPLAVEANVRMIIGDDRFRPIFGSTDLPCPTVMSDFSPNTCGQLEERTGITIQRRKFTIRELKRICAFPDDFILTGTYAQQWARLGNSVPPVMMRAIATEIRDRVLLKVVK